MTPRLRVVVFTAGEVTPVNRVFFERLAKDPLIDLAAIIVDEYRPRRKPLVTRIIRAVREDGPRWIAFKIRSKFEAMLDRAALRIADRIHGPRRADANVPATIHRVSDIHSAQSIDLIRSLSPDLGVIVGGRILSESVISIPKRGTLNIHKRKLPEYRGGGPVGYWEILAGEPSIGVSIHFATRDVDAGPVIAQTTIAIEKLDTLASLKLKADIRGAELYIDAVRRVASGEVQAIPQDLSRGKTYRAPSDYKVWTLERRLERASGVSWLTRLRLLAQFVVVLPHLQRVRRKLIRQQRAPISVFFYHLVSNRQLNHMCLPFVAFARQIEFLRRYYAIRSLDETVERLRSGRNREIAASITFDDGYRDNAWAIEYLRYFEIPATFFVSIGHVRDGSAFEHDRRRGYENARPMTAADVQQLAGSGFTVGSHGVYHEDFGRLTPGSADRILAESRAQIAEVSGRTPRCFAFPKGQRGVNITRPALDLALKHFGSVFSAYGGYSFPEAGRRHFLRIGNPTNVLDLNLIMSGYTGFRDCLAGNAWGLKTEKLDPCGTTTPKTAIALIAASPSIIGGHSVQAQALAAKLSEDGHEVLYVPIDVRFPRWLQPIRRMRYARTLVNELLYVLSLRRLTRVDVVHVFSASYWSFVLGPAPAILVAKFLRKPVVLHYHSGEADDHLKRWRAVVRPLLWLADEIVVPSTYLQCVFASHGYRVRVIPNVIQTWRFRYRERSTPRPRLLSARNLEPHYRVEKTINAFVRLKERYPEATLTIAGCGSQDASLRLLTEKLGVSGIHFVGAIDPAAMPKTYDAADIFVNTSAIDNQPVSILEAFAAGLPVVSTPTGDIPSMLRGGEAGVLVDSDDDAAVADAVTRLLDQPELSVRIARRAREEADRYTWRRVGAEWNTLYAELLSSGGGEALAHGV